VDPAETAPLEIVTEGEGRVERPGDRAGLTVGFVSVAGTRAEAVAALSAQVGVAPVERAGVTVRRRRLWVHDDWRAEQVVGVRAGEELVLRVEDVDALEPLVAALVAVEPASLTGPVWELVDPAPARREAQALAVADARDRARGYADALGGRLAGPRRLTEALDPHAVAAHGLAGGAGLSALGLHPEPVAVVVRCAVTWTVEL
jgi:uncharacterized protein YggE